MRRLLWALALLALPGLAAAQTKVNTPITVGPGLNADGPSISPYLPQTCDAVTAANGAINSAATLFNASGFVAADVGKSIVIQGAGANYRIAGSAINTAGSGYAVGDVVTLASGISVTIRSISATPSAGTPVSYTFNSTGNSATNPATIAQVGAAVPPGGTGLVLDTTWEKRPHATTIASFVSATQVNLTAAAGTTVAGASWAFGTNMQPTIQAGIDGNKSVVLPRGLCGIASTVALKPETTLVGQGHGIGGNYQTALIWLGAPDGVMVEGNTDTVGAGVISVRFGNMNLLGFESAAISLKLRGVHAGDFYPFESTGAILACLDMAPSTIVPLGNFQNNFYDIQCRDAAKTASGVLWNRGGNSLSNNANRYYSIRVNHSLDAEANGIAIWCGSADHNIIGPVRLRGQAGVAALQMHGGMASDVARCAGNVWTLVDPGDGGAEAWADDPTLPSVNNILNYDRQNSPKDYTIHDTAALSVMDSNGLHDGLILRNRSFGNIPAFIGPGGLYWVTNSNTAQVGAAIAGGGTSEVLAFKDASDVWRVLSPQGAKAVLNAAHQSPTGTASTSYVMMGLGATAAITPTNSGRLSITAWGNIGNNTANNGAKARLVYGTGTAPVNGAAQTGSGACANTPNVAFDSTANNQSAPFSMTCIVSGLTPATAYWIDLSVAAITAGTATVTGVSVQALEQ